MWKEKTGINGRVYKWRDLSGLQVGSYTVLHKGSTKIRGKRLITLWTSQCECGNIRELEYSNIMGAIKKIAAGTVSIFSCGCKSSLPFGVSAAKAMYRQYKVHANNRGYEFKLSFEQLLAITKENCHYCGAIPNNKIGNVGKMKRGNGYYTYNGVDRMDNTRGYFSDNVVPCCKRCNRAKDVMGKTEFLKWIEQVYNHSFGENEYKRLLKAV